MITFKLSIESFSKVSFDYDGTLSTKKGKELAKKLIESGDDVYIISARSDKSSMESVARELGIPMSRVFATGSNSKKIEEIKKLNISKHYDNNSDVVKELGSIGIQFKIDVNPGETEDEFISRCMKVEVGSGKDKDQAYAICISKWENK